MCREREYQKTWQAWRKECDMEVWWFCNGQQRRGKSYTPGRGNEGVVGNVEMITRMGETQFRVLGAGAHVR